MNDYPPSVSFSDELVHKRAIIVILPEEILDELNNGNGG